MRSLPCRWKDSHNRQNRAVHSTNAFLVRLRTSEQRGLSPITEEGYGRRSRPKAPREELGSPGPQVPNLRSHASCLFGRDHRPLPGKHAVCAIPRPTFIRCPASLRDYRAQIVQGIASMCGRGSAASPQHAPRQAIVDVSIV
jgi:hypothetical protein